jgi:hypothetical protein
VVSILKFRRGKFYSQLGLTGGFKSRLLFLKLPPDRLRLKSPLPDLKLFDEAPKSDFNRSRSGGSLRKSKRDLKPPVNPNWL